jgi:hypothetical protein
LTANATPGKDPTGRAQRKDPVAKSIKETAEATAGAGWGDGSQKKIHELLQSRMDQLQVISHKQRIWSLATRGQNTAHVESCVFLEDLDVCNATSEKLLNVNFDVLSCKTH